MDLTGGGRAGAFVEPIHGLQTPHQVAARCSHVLGFSVAVKSVIGVSKVGIGEMKL